MLFTVWIEGFLHTAELSSLGGGRFTVCGVGWLPSPLMCSLRVQSPGRSVATSEFCGQNQCCLIHSAVLGMFILDTCTHVHVHTHTHIHTHTDTHRDSHTHADSHMQTLSLSLSLSLSHTHTHTHTQRGGHTYRTTFLNTFPEMTFCKDVIQVPTVHC